MSEHEKNNQGGPLKLLGDLLHLKPGQVGILKLLVVALAVGILLMNAPSLFGVDEMRKRPDGATEVATPSKSARDELSRLEQEKAQELQATLSQIRGAGQIYVQISLAAGPAVQPVTNTRTQETTTSEKAGDNSTRNTTTREIDTTHVTTKDGSQDQLAVSKQVGAEIAGVLIVADGARNPAVANRLLEAAGAALHIPAHRIQVVPREGR